MIMWRRWLNVLSFGGWIFNEGHMILVKTFELFVYPWASCNKLWSLQHFWVFLSPLWYDYRIIFIVTYNCDTSSVNTKNQIWLSVITNSQIQGKDGRQIEITSKRKLQNIFVVSLSLQSLPNLSGACMVGNLHLKVPFMKPSSPIAQDPLLPNWTKQIRK